MNLLSFKIKITHSDNFFKKIEKIQNIYNIIFEVIFLVLF